MCDQTSPGSANQTGAAQQRHCNCDRTTLTGSRSDLSRFLTCCRACSSSSSHHVSADTWCVRMQTYSQERTFRTSRTSANMPGPALRSQCHMPGTALRSRELQGKQGNIARQAAADLQDGGEDDGQRRGLAAGRRQRRRSALLAPHHRREADVELLQTRAGNPSHSMLVHRPGSRGMGGSWS